MELLKKLRKSLTSLDLEIDLPFLDAANGRLVGSANLIASLDRLDH